MYSYRKTILNIEIRIDNINSVYFSFLFFIIQAIAIKQSEIVTYNIIHYKLRQYTKYQEKDSLDINKFSSKSNPYLTI